MDGFDTDGELLALVDRVDQQGIVVIPATDGTMFVFSRGHLERMLEDAKKSPNGHVAVFVKTRPIKKGNA